MPRNQIRWYSPAKGAMPVSKREYLELQKEGQEALYVQIRRLSRAEIRLQDLRHLTDGVYEIRVQVGRNHYRATLIQDSPVHFIILSCFYKNSQKTPKNELDKALQRAKEWRSSN